MKRSLAEYSFLCLFFSVAVLFAERWCPAFQRKEKRQLTVTLHFSFYVEDYSNSMIHLQGVFFLSQSTEGRAFLPRFSVIFHYLRQSCGISVSRIALVWKEKMDFLLGITRL